VGRVTGIRRKGDTVVVDAPPARAAVEFPAADVVRTRVAPLGRFTDTAGIVVKKEGAGVVPDLTETADYFLLRTEAVALRVYKDDLRFGLYRPDDAVRLVEEVVGLHVDGGVATQRLTQAPGEQYFGGGMQNGRFSHRHATLNVAVSYEWNEGGWPNSVPFYVSTGGYGLFRNTFAAGVYSFTAPLVLRHQEERCDAYWFVGDVKHVVDRYTELTGRPFLPPIYGLEPGDADCYCHNANRGERHTLDALAVADGYVERGIPLGWMLVNDGYGCGYEDLDRVAAGLADRHVTLGLWTSTGLPDQKREVRSGARVRKLDVAWVGPGHRFALDACQAAYEGIERWSDGRGFVWTPEGWAGSQRYAVHWSGDQAGSWDYVRWQIPTYAGATLSGLAYTTGDVDGIYGGSPETYTRDLQWKTFLPVAMTMSGWAPTDKQPWHHGEPYTSINRRYLQLRERLLPYFYTYSALAHRTGLGMIRPLALEYPDDPTAFHDDVRYQFLCGDAFLVAPVFEDADVRHRIYLPAGTWFDYWTGEAHRGPAWLDGHPAPLDRLPLFVKGGSIVPRWPEGTLSWAARDTGRLDVDVWPDGPGVFELYEDDGVTRQYADGRFAWQRFTVEPAGGDVAVTIGPSGGDYDAKPQRRRYRVRLRGGGPPVVADTPPVPTGETFTLTIPRASTPAG
jgi:alpha-glucosidase (family GH31 glycosyl hydrolase)